MTVCDEAPYEISDPSNPLAWIFTVIVSDSRLPSKDEGPVTVNDFVPSLASQVRDVVLRL